MVILALITYPVDKTGHAAEKVVEERTTFDEAFIHEHEAAASYATPIMYITGLLAFTGIIISRGNKPIPSWLKVAIVIAALFAQTSMIRTGYLGGKIRRPELQNAQNANAAAEEEEDD